jgi:hypothetical protein
MGFIYSNSRDIIILSPPIGLWSLKLTDYQGNKETFYNHLQCHVSIGSR